MICDNTRACHFPIVISDTDDAMRVYCNECGLMEILRKDWRGVPENRAYAKFFKRDILQPNDPLFYKYYPTYLNT